MAKPQIKAIITDVDGVMVGKKEGVNFPLPPDDVIKTLKRLHDTGIAVVLCTAKFWIAIEQIIVRGQLKNPHISDAGALIINPLGQTKIIEESPLDPSVVIEYLENNKSHIELYTAEKYYVGENANQELVNNRAKLMPERPERVKSLVDIARHHDVIKIITLNGSDDIPQTEARNSKFAGRAEAIWTSHPFLDPYKISVVTAPGISKKHAARVVANYLKLPFDNILGIGDSASDWNFMELCRFVATTGPDKEIQDLAKTKTENYIAGSVDDKAILDIFQHFGLGN